MFRWPGIAKLNKRSTPGITFGTVYFMDSSPFLERERAVGGGGGGYTIKDICADKDVCMMFKQFEKL